MTCRLLGGMLLAFLLSPPASAEMGEATVRPSLPSAEQIQTRISEIEADAGLDQELKAKVVERFRSALRELARLKEAAAAEAQFQQDARTAAERVAAVKAELKKLARPPEKFEFDLRGTSDLEAELANREAAVAVLRQRLKEIETLRKQRDDRRAEIHRSLTEVAPRSAELRQQVDAAASADEAPLMSEARRLEARLKLEVFERIAAATEFELAKYTAEETVKLLTHEEDLKRQSLAREESVAQALAQEIRNRRRAETENQIRAAEQQKLLTHPLLKDEAERNRLYAEEIRQISTRIGGVFREARQTRERLERQQAEFADLRAKEKDIGLTRPIGLMLREQRSELPDLREFRRKLDGRQELIEESRLMSWRYADELAGLPTAQSVVEEIISDASLPKDQWLELERMAEELLQTRRELLTELEETSKRYFDALYELDAVERRYIQSSHDDLRYINERILWIRSADPLTFGAVTSDLETWRWMFSPESWRGIGDALSTEPVEHPFVFWPALVGLISLFALRMRIRPRLRVLGEEAAKRGLLRYGPTAQAAVLTVISALAVPAALLFVAWRVEPIQDPTRFAQAIAMSLVACAAALFPIELLREACRHLGLAEAHFCWPPRSVNHLRRVLSRTKTIGLPVVFLATLAHEHQPLSGGLPAERLLFIGGMLLVAVTLHWLLSARSELVKASVVDYPNSLFTRFRGGWYALGLVVPVGMAVLSGLGHHYTAAQLADRLLWTAWLAVGAVVMRAMAIRWIVLSRRRLLLEQAYQRRAAAADEMQESPGAVPKPPVIEETDVARSTAQTRKLVNIVALGLSATILAMIWAETLPAFGLLDRKLWDSETGSRPVATSAPTGSPIPLAGATSQPAGSTPADTGLVAVTTADLAIAILLALFTFLASRNLPGLMEMSVLNRLPVDNATRYAATRLASYAIVIVGVLMASNKLGLRWQNVQWLVAALTVGLGFGLQEVFANFVSGLIILFERPVRVGDIVTIDEVTGVVSRIRMRATTITNWDRKEFIVPNKEFITGRVLNWTLSDATNRITVNVSIAFGSDTEQARQVMLRICDENPLVLKDPAPVACFEGFGNNALNLVLRCYLPSLDNRLEVINYLHSQIVRRFGEAGIDLTSPQLDLNIRTPHGFMLPTPLPAKAERPPVERAAG